MRCLKIYDRLANMQSCKSCGSTYVVHYEEEKKSKTPPASTSPSLPSGASADAVSKAFGGDSAVEASRYWRGS
jgi:predicted  nucleic acid-binding Zn-ribbon protein